MTKLLLDDKSDVLVQGEWLTVRAMRRSNGRLPAKEWARGLDKRGRAKLAAAVANLENSLRYGRPTTGRTVKVRGARIDLWEPRITPRGASPPHLRLIYRPERRTLWAAHGFKKQTNELTTRDIEAAEAVAREWLARR